jgi:hypothetical protein
MRRVPLKPVLGINLEAGQIKLVEERITLRHQPWQTFTTGENHTVREILWREKLKGKETTARGHDQQANSTNQTKTG